MTAVPTETGVITPLLLTVATAAASAGTVAEAVELRQREAVGETEGEAVGLELGQVEGVEEVLGLLLALLCGLGGGNFASSMANISFFFPSSRQGTALGLNAGLGHLGVALVHTALALPFSILVSSSLFMGIPRELEEAAWTLGCNKWQAFMRIVMPLALPGMAATMIFSFVVSWNEVFSASVLTLSNRTLTAFLFAGLEESPLHFRFAGGFFLILPSLVFIFMVRKYLFSMWGISNR